MNRILVTGACGQFGAELTEELRSLYGRENVIASDITKPGKKVGEGPYERVDVMDHQRLEEVVRNYRITEIYHLAALLSAKSEQKIEAAWDLNMSGLFNILNIARDHDIDKVFWPSSIAVFGPDAPPEMTPQDTVLHPSTVYGISKLAGEQWCAYYHRTFGVDVRSLRYPGLVGYKSLPGGGTTDYAVEIFHKALAGEVFSCYLEQSTTLPMMYMKDAVKAAVELMQAEPDDVTVRTSYNISSISFSPDELASAIKKRIPDFRIAYAPDYRQKIAETWPRSIDDSVAKKDWGWNYEYDLERITEDMLKNLPVYFG